MAYQQNSPYGQPIQQQQQQQVPQQAAQQDVVTGDTYRYALQNFVRPTCMQLATTLDITDPLLPFSELPTRK